MVTKGKRNAARSASNQVEQLSRPNPRINLRGRLNENVSYIGGNEYANPATVPGTAAIGVGRVPLIPGNSSDRTNAAIQKVGQYFQKGLFLPGTHLRYIPSVGLNTAGNIIIGFIDSPEVMRTYFALASSSVLNFIRDLSNAKTGPVWQELTFPLTQPPRRKIFSVDNSITSTDLDSIDQSIQGMFVWAVYGVDTVSTDKTYGQFLLHCSQRFEEVKSFALTS